LAQDKFIAADATYTATTMNTMNSHYMVMPMTGTPANWKSPVDYSTGSVSVRMEVLEKPSDKKTLVNICFQGNVETCMNYPPAYTKPGVITFNGNFSTFWQYSMFDFSKGIQSVAVSLKDETEMLAQGNADFYPTKVKLTVTVTAKSGATMMPTNDDDAGTPRDAGMPRDAGQIPPGPSTPVDAGVPPATAPMNPVGAAAGTGVAAPPVAPSNAGAPAAAGASAATAGTVAAGAGAPDAGQHRVSQYLESDTGCSTTRGGNEGSLWLFAGAGFYLAWRGRSRRRSS
jgi:hypothetical protein